MTTQRSRKKAIHDFCKWCLNDPHEPGTWRRQVTRCTSPSCPLYAFRPLAVENSAFTGSKPTHVEQDVVAKEKAASPCQSGRPSVKTHGCVDAES